MNKQVPDLVNSKTSVRAAFYRESHEFVGAAKEKHPRKFLALYQTDFEECLESRNYLDDVRHDSELFPKSKLNADNGEFDARYYKLIQEYDPDKRGESE